MDVQMHIHNEVILYHIDTHKHTIHTHIHTYTQWVPLCSPHTLNLDLLEVHIPPSLFDQPGFDPKSGCNSSLPKGVCMCHYVLLYLLYVCVVRILFFGLYV